MALNTASDDAASTSQGVQEASESLGVAIEKAGLNTIPSDRIPLLEKYCQLLWEWNARLNLTRHTSYDLFVRRDLLDSLKLSELLREGEEILDVGTGGGVPGIPVAILRPDIQVTLCDSVGKKAAAIDAIVKSLGMAIPVYGTRAQDLLQDFRYSSIVARAVGPLPRMLGWFTDLWYTFDRLLAIKGPRWIEERAEARHRGLLRGIELRKVAEYPMPDTHSMSVILQMTRPKPQDEAASRKR